MKAHRQRGFALVSVLWGTVLLALLAANLLRTARTDVALASNLVAAAEAEALADAGVHRALFALLARDTAGQWQADGRSYELPLAGGQAVVSIQDEAGKIDVNNAPDELLLAALSAAGADRNQAMALCDAILDYRDEDNAPRRYGAERDRYAADGTLAPRNGPLEALTELRGVPGMTPELYRRVAPLLTIWSGAGTIDPGVAPPALLRALPGFEERSVQAVLAARLAPSPENTGLDGIDTSASSLLAASDRRAFTIRATASTSGGGRFIRDAVIELTGDPAHPFLIRSWGRSAGEDS
jgi:general secretion pathway protein K